MNNDLNDIDFMQEGNQLVIRVNFNNLMADDT